MSSGKTKSEKTAEEKERKAKDPGRMAELLNFDPVNMVSDVWDAFDMWRGTRRWGPILMMIPGALLLLSVCGVAAANAIFGTNPIMKSYATKAAEVDPLKDGFGVKKDKPKDKTDAGGGLLTDENTADDERDELLSEAEKAAKAQEEAKDGQFADLLYRRILQLQNDNKNAKYRVANAMGRRGNMDQARAMIKSLAPSDGVGYPYAHAWLAFDLYNRLAMQERMDMVEFKNEFTHHVIAASEAQIAEPDWAKVLSLYATFLLSDKSDKDHGEAINMLQRAANLDPTFLIRLSEVYRVKGQNIQSRDAADSAVARFKERLGKRDELDSDRIMVARAYVMSNKFDDAIKVLQEGFKIRSDRPKLRRALSDVYRTMFRAQVVRAENGYKANLGLLNMALTTDPTNPAVGEEIMWLQNLGVTVSEAMIQSLREQLASGGASAVTHLLLGNAYFNQKNLEKAIQHWELALRTDPKMVLALNNLAVAYSQLDKPIFDQAVQLIDQAIDLSSGDPEFYDSKGEILFRAEKYVESIAAYEKALQRAPARIGTREKLIESYQKAGMTDMVDAQLNAIGRIRDELRARGFAEKGNLLIPIKKEEPKDEEAAKDAPAADESKKAGEKTKEPAVDVESIFDGLNKK